METQEYFTSLRIPADTPKDQPETKTVEVEGEFISELAYLIPPGWVGLARFAIFYGIEQIYPDPTLEWVTGNDLYRPVPLRWKLPEPKVTLTIKGYNEDTRYSHTVYLWIRTAPIEVVKPLRILADLVQILKKLMGLS